MRPQRMDRDFVTTARTLSEALPYMQRYAGAVVVAVVALYALEPRVSGAVSR